MGFSFSTSFRVLLYAPLLLSLNIFADSTQSVHLEEKVDTFEDERASETDENVRCPTLNIDPPPNVLDQGETGMCASFAAHALLQTHMRRHGQPPLPANVNLSVMSLNQKVVTEYKTHGEIDPFGENVGHILRDVQTSHERISTDKAFPYFWGHGSGFKAWATNLRKQAAEHFNTNPDLDVIRMGLSQGGDAPTVRLVRKESAPRTGLDHEDVDLLIPTGADDFEAFHESYSRRPEIPAFPSNYPDYANIPPFRTIQRTFDPSTSGAAEELHDILVEGLGSGSPTSVSVCMTQVEKDMAAVAGEPFNDSDPSGCGSHAMAAVGMHRDNRGRCMVRILNSWGSEWNGDGMVDIPVEKLAEYMAYNKPGKGARTSTNLTYLSPSDERTNEVELNGQFEVELNGQLRSRIPYQFIGEVNPESDEQVRGRLVFGDTPLGPKVIEGSLSNQFNLRNGQATNLDNYSVNGEQLYYTGQMRDGEPHGHGTFRYSDGRVFQSGTFANGRFNRGSGTSNASSGSNVSTGDLEELRRLLRELQNR